MDNFDESLLKLDIANKHNISIPKTLNILPLRDIIIFPYMIFPVLIGRASSLRAVAEAVDKEKFIFVTAQRNSAIEEPTFDDIYQYGTTARIIQLLRLPNNLVKVLVEGIFQSKIKKAKKSKDYLSAEITQLPIHYVEGDKEFEATMRHTSELFIQYVKENRNLPPDIIGAYENINDPVRKLFFAAANVQQKVEVKQVILEKTNLKEQYFELAKIISAELELLKLEDEIDSKVQDTIHKTQKKFFIQEQIRALQKELGEDEESLPELAAIKEAIEKADMPEMVKNKAYEEFERLKKTPTMSPVFAVNRTYLENLTSLTCKT